MSVASIYAHKPVRIAEGWKKLYSLTSPYRHLSITDSSFGPRNVKHHTFPTSIIRTLGSVLWCPYFRGWTVHFFVFWKHFYHEIGMTDNFRPLYWCVCCSMSFILLLFYKARQVIVEWETKKCTLPCPLLRPIEFPSYLFTQNALCKTQEMAFPRP